MNLNFDMSLLEKIAEGIIVLNRTGQISDFNHAAEPWLATCQRATESLATLIAQVIKSKITTPIPVRFFHQDKNPDKAVEVFLCSNGLADFSLVIIPLRPEAQPIALNDAPHFSVLLGREIRHEMTHLRAQLSALAPQGTNPDFTAVVQRSERLSRLFVTMDQLATLSQAGTFFQGERLSLLDLINSVLRDMPRARCDYALNDSMSDPQTQHGMLYGDSEWFKCGLRGLLEGIGDSSPARSQIELRVRQSGSFIVLTGAFANVPSTRKKSALAAVLDPAEEALGIEADIRIPIARRIFELHGGQLRIAEMDSNNPDEFQRGVESFTLILPTGGPYEARNPSCEKCLGPSQAEAYARDLLALMPAPTVRADLSHDELEFLHEVMSDTKSRPRAQEEPQ